jgi:hypothetical protein
MRLSVVPLGSANVDPRRSGSHSLAVSTPLFVSVSFTDRLCRFVFTLFLLVTLNRLTPTRPSRLLLVISLVSHYVRLWRPCVVPSLVAVADSGRYQRLIGSVSIRGVVCFLRETITSASSARSLFPLYKNCFVLHSTARVSHTHPPPLASSLAVDSLSSCGSRLASSPTPLQRRLSVAPPPSATYETSKQRCPFVFPVESDCHCSRFCL